MIFVYNFLPSLLCLLTFYFLDNFKLISPKRLLISFLLGIFSAITAYYVNNFAFSIIPDNNIFTIIIAPVTEELLKTSIILFYFKKNRIGFLTDAALLAFIIGIGFATFENLWYIHNFTETNMLVWLIRGTGTALLHSSAVIVFSISYYFLKEISKANFFIALIPAVILHSIFNLPILPIIPKVFTQLVLLPIIVYILFTLSEKKLKLWMEKDFMADMELLEMIKSGNFSKTKTGQYLAKLSKNFPPLVKVDMFCYTTLYIELSFLTKGILLMREIGIEEPLDQSALDKLNELKSLEKEIGKTILRTLNPLLPNFDKKMWQMLFLKDNI